MPQTSLIPKKITPRFQYAGATLGVFFRIAVVFFLLSGALAGGLFAYRSVVAGQLQEQKSVLQKLEVEFEPSLITELERVAGNISIAKTLLDNHVRLTGIFAFLEENTLQSTKFNSFSYNHDTKTMNLTGEASSYAAVAAQAKVLRALSRVASARFSGFSLREETGNVNFNVNVVLNR